MDEERGGSFMIVIEKTDHFIMIPQHEHAGISGSIVDHWKNHFLLRSKLREGSGLGDPPA